MNHELRSLGLGLLLAAGALSGCSRASEAAPSSAPIASETAPVGAGNSGSAALPASVASLKATVTNRKIIRQAELELEVPAAGTAQTAIEHLAERHGGYVVSSARDTDNATAVDVRVTVVVRVPQAELTDAITELKHMGRGVGSERITSDDVTDEYVDLAARAASQTQLEQQYLDILKRATTVKDALEVQKALADVRTEIERMQGRKQLLEKESAFSTLTVHLSTAVPRVAITSTTFGGSIRRAWTDAQTLSIEIIIGAIRLLGVILPILMILVLPCALAFWTTLRAKRWLAARKPRTLLAA